MSIRILLVDDHSLFRQGIRSLLERTPGHQVAGEAENGRAAIQLIKTVFPDVVVMDLRMPDLNGIDATRQALEALPGIKVIGLSGHSDDTAIREMLRAGAAGFVRKDSTFEELISAIQTVMENKVYLSPSISGVLMRGYFNGGDTANSAFVRLSPREREVLQLFSEGKSTKEVASVLSLSIKTVETHRRNLLGKTNASGIADLTRYAIREGITSL